MRETELSRRQILAILLIFVILFASFTAYICIDMPGGTQSSGSRHTAIISCLIVVVAGVWIIKLLIDAVQDRRHGVERGPAKVTGWFHIWFGGLVALMGVGCSALSYFSASWAGGGMWKVYTGFILYGVIELLIGCKRLQDASSKRAQPGSEANGE